MKRQNLHGSNPAARFYDNGTTVSVGKRGVTDYGRSAFYGVPAAFDREIIENVEAIENFNERRDERKACEKRNLYRSPRRQSAVNALYWDCVSNYLEQGASLDDAKKAAVRELGLPSKLDRRMK